MPRSEAQMSKSLTDLISQAQAMLLDDGTRFSSATLTSAFSAALTLFNHHAPIHAADLLDVVSDSLEYEASGGSFERILRLTDVLEYDEDGDEHTPLKYTYYCEDNRHFFRLNESQTSGYLVVRFDQRHIINGLNSETETSLTDDQAEILVFGACSHACSIRAAGILEDNLVSPDAVKSLFASAGLFQNTFVNALANIDNPPAPPSGRAWLSNDIKRVSSSQASSLKDV